MNLYRHKNQLLIVFLVVGFFLGILYENIIARSQGVSVNLFQSYFLEQYAQTEIIAEDYLWYVAQLRLVPFLGICILGCLKWKKVLVGTILVWTGFLTGVFTVSAVMQLGIKGILVCLAGLLPHMIFYGVAYSVLLIFLYRYPQRQWNTQKTIFIIILVFLGIMTETYLNPFLMRLVVRIL